MGENNQAVILRKVQPDDYKLFEEWWNDYEIADDVRSTTEWVSAKTVREKFSEWDERNDDLGFGLTIQGRRKLMHASRCSLGRIISSMVTVRKRFVLPSARQRISCICTR